MKPLIEVKTKVSGEDVYPIIVVRGAPNRHFEIELAGTGVDPMTNRASFMVCYYEEGEFSHSSIMDHVLLEEVLNNTHIADRNSVESVKHFLMQWSASSIYHLLTTKPYIVFGFVGQQVILTYISGSGRVLCGQINNSVNYYKDAYRFFIQPALLNRKRVALELHTGNDPDEPFSTEHTHVVVEKDLLVCAFTIAKKTWESQDTSTRLFSEAGYNVLCDLSSKSTLINRLNLFGFAKKPA